MLACCHFPVEEGKIGRGCCPLGFPKPQPSPDAIIQPKYLLDLECLPLPASLKCPQARLRCEACTSHHPSVRCFCWWPVPIIGLLSLVPSCRCSKAPEISLAYISVCLTSQPTIFLPAVNCRLMLSCSNLIS